LTYPERNFLTEFNNFSSINNVLSVILIWSFTGTATEAAGHSPAWRVPDVPGYPYLPFPIPGHVPGCQFPTGGSQIRRSFPRNIPCPVMRLQARQFPDKPLGTVAGRKRAGVCRLPGLRPERNIRKVVKGQFRKVELPDAKVEAAIAKKYRVAELV
jgi:hypothetical protein